jgi:hypothetical protein
MPAHTGAEVLRDGGSLGFVEWAARCRRGGCEGLALRAVFFVADGTSALPVGTCGTEKCTRDAVQGTPGMEFSTAKRVHGSWGTENEHLRKRIRARGGPRPLSAWLTCR